MISFYKNGVGAARRKGSVLVLTLLIVTLMSSATMSAAVTSYQIIGNANSYNNSMAARETALAGVSDYLNRLEDEEIVDKSMLFNFDEVSTEAVAVDEEVASYKKKPYARYYSFTPEQKLTNIGRCTKAAIISPWDTTTATYLAPANPRIFININSKIAASNYLKQISNPLTEKKADGSNLYTVGDEGFWIVKMGGPMDQADVGSTAWLSYPKEFIDKMFTGLFSNPGYLSYDLLYLPLPQNRILELDDETRVNLEKWILEGGRLWIDNTGMSALRNAPFSKDGPIGTQENENFKKYKFNWDYLDTWDSNNVKANYPMTGTENPANILKDDSWVTDNAYNFQNDGTVNWKKAQLFNTKINKDFQVRVIRPKSVKFISYPGTDYEVNDAIKAADNAKTNNKLYMRYGDLSTMQVGQKLWFYDSVPISSGYYGFSSTIKFINRSDNYLVLDNYNLCKRSKTTTGCTVVPDNNIVSSVLKKTTGLIGSYDSDFSPVYEETFYNTSGYSTFGFPANTNILKVNDVRSLTVGSAIEVLPSLAGESPFWGVVKTIPSIPDGAAWNVSIPGDIGVELKTGPLPRYGHSLVKVSDTSALLFGGYSINIYAKKDNTPNIYKKSNCTSPFSQVSPSAMNDVWKVDWNNVTGSITWTRIKADSESYYSLFDNTLDNTLPIPRAYAVAGYDSSIDRLVIASGEFIYDEYQSTTTLSDFWYLGNATNNLTANWIKGKSMADLAISTTGISNTKQEVIYHYSDNFKTRTVVTRGATSFTVDYGKHFLAVGDEIRLSSGNSRLEGKVSAISYNNSITTIGIEGGLKGQDSIPSNTIVNVLRHNDAIVNTNPDDQLINNLARYDLAGYYNSTTKEQYWGVVDDLTDTPSKYLHRFTKSPYPRTKAGGFVKDGYLYIYGGATHSAVFEGTYANRVKDLNDLWRVPVNNANPNWTKVDIKSEEIKTTPTAAKLAVLSGGAVSAMGPSGAINKDVSSITLQAGSAYGLAVGDIIRVNSSRGSNGLSPAAGGPIYKKIETINYNTNTLTLSAVAEPISKDITGQVDSITGVPLPESNTGWNVDLYSAANSGTRTISSVVNEGNYPKEATLDSLVGVALGDVVKIYNNSSALTVYSRIIGIDSSTNKITLQPAYDFGPAKRSSFAYTNYTDNSGTQGMFIFGGRMENNSYNNEVWLLKDSLGVWTWDRIYYTSNTNPIPNGRADAAISYDQTSNNLTLYGGTISLKNKLKFNGIWRLSSAATGGQDWSKKFPLRSDIINSVCPDGRSGTEAVNLGGKMFFFGGVSWPNTHKMSTTEAEANLVGSTKANSRVFTEINERTGDPNYDISWDRALALGIYGGKSTLGEPSLTLLGTAFQDILTYPTIPYINFPNVITTLFEDEYTGATNTSIALANAGGGVILLTSNNMGGGSLDKNYYDVEQNEDIAFLFNTIILYQTQNRARVTGYYGGVARSYIITYTSNREVTDISEVPAE